MSTITIIGPQFSTFVRTIELICQYKDIAYQLSMEYQGNSIELRNQQHQALHPFCKIPILVDGDLVLPESYAIASYLDKKSSSSIFPSNDKCKAQVDAWSNMIALYVYRDVISNYLLEIRFPKGENGEIRMDKIKENKPTAVATLQVLEQKIADTGYFIGDQFTLCDALLLPILTYALATPAPFNINENLPKLTKYLDQMSDMPYCKSVLTLPQD